MLERLLAFEVGCRKRWCCTKRLKRVRVKGGDNPPRTMWFLPTRLKQRTIQSGTKTTSQLQATNPSNFKGRKTNSKALTARNNSISKDRSCLTAHTHAPTLATLAKISGTNTNTQMWRPVCRWSQASNSNISKMRCIESEISIALKWEYESPSSR